MTAFVASDVLNDELLTKITTVAGAVEGDEPSLLVGYTPDVGAAFYAEGQEITAQTPTLGQWEVKTHKVAALVNVTNELDRAGNAGNVLAEGMRRGLARKANEALFNNASAPTGILNDSDLAAATALGTSLDSFNTAYWSIAETGVTPNYIVGSPSAMAALGSIKAATGSNQPLVDDMTVMGLPVYVSTAMAADRFLIGHTSAVVSAVGPLRLAKSQDAAFAYDATSLRATWRFGWAVVQPDRLAVISTAA
ncbi:phage major capsid protein [Ornithinimicrobium cerasi]|uniref:phage major capsid protein n=1 Tax=Ornithinimicrobium cerasi TaxID=2248773 RepID=UPI00137B2CDB|nr:phage major capsid protein [Ornithinimicrobium cerasi]